MNKTQSIISALCVIIVQAAAMCGVALDAGAVTTALSIVAAFAALVWGLYKNHTFSDAALAAQQFLNAAKGKDVEEETDIDAEPAGTDGGDE